MNFRGFWKWNNKLFQLNCISILGLIQLPIERITKKWQTPINLIKSSSRTENVFETFQLTKFPHIFNKRKIHLISYSNFVMPAWYALTNNRLQVNKRISISKFLSFAFIKDAISYTLNLVWCLMTSQMHFCNQKQGHTESEYLLWLLLVEHWVGMHRAFEKKAIKYKIESSSREKSKSNEL